MKICIERSDRMGDMILTLPVIQAIKENNPHAIIHVIASQKNIKSKKVRRKRKRSKKPLK